MIIMSAVLCGKRSFFEDIESAATSPTSDATPVNKKLRCSLATSPVRFNCSTPVHPSLVDQLRVLCPEMGIQLLTEVLEESGNDIDSAINTLNKLHRGDTKCKSGLAAAEDSNMKKAPFEDPKLVNFIPADGAEWVALLVREMMTATSIEDARSRAAYVLESLEKSICARASAEAAEGFHKENVVLKEHIEALLRDNAILKRAVAIQHERQKEYDERSHEAQQLERLVDQYQEQLRTLEVNNYALMLELRQAQVGRNSIPGRFHPDIF